MSRSVVRVDETPPAAGWWQFYQTHDLVARVLERHRAVSGVGPTQARALLALQACAGADAVGPMMTVLAHTLRIRPATTTTLVDSLERRGWVRRQRDPCNRRAIQLELTEAGAAKAAEVQARTHEALAQCFAGLEASEVRELAGLLARVGP